VPPSSHPNEGAIVLLVTIACPAVLVWLICTARLDELPVSVDSLAGVVMSGKTWREAVAQTVAQ